MTTDVSPSVPSKPWTVAAWAVAGIGWLLAAGAIALALGSQHVPGQLAFWLMDVTVAILYGVAVIMLLPSTRHPVAWVLAATAWGCGVAAIAEPYVAIGGDRVGQDLLYFAQFWAWVPGMYATIAVLPWLVVGPRGTLRTAAVVAGSAASVLAMLPGLTYAGGGPPFNPWAVKVGWWQSFVFDLAVDSWPDRAVTALGVLAVVRVALVRRSLPSGERVGLGWLLCGQLAMVLAMVVFLWPWPDDRVGAAGTVSGILLLLAQAFLPAAVLVLVLGQRLWGVETTVNRATLWTSATAAVVAGYLVVVGTVGAVLPDGSGIAPGVSIAVMGLALAWLRPVLQRQVDRLVYGVGSDPSRLWESIDVSSDHDLAELAESLRHGLRLGSARIVPADPTGEVVVTEGPAAATVLSLVSRGEEVGALVVEARPGERLDRRTLDLLQQVAGLLATVLDLARSNEALAAARSRLVGIRTEERRALRRDLHDGLGPALAGIRLGLTASRNVRSRDPQAADRMLDELGVELQRRSEDIRKLSRGLLPPALDDGDLRRALDALADRFADSGLGVHVDVAPDLAPDSAAQIALYNIASEAVLNVHRHADAQRCDVLLRPRHDGGVLLIVADDGVGIDPAVVPGIGLRSMSERAEELGGTVDITAVESGGTRIAVRLPAHPAP